jgi:hypothetical protein
MTLGTAGKIGDRGLPMRVQLPRRAAPHYDIKVIVVGAIDLVFAEIDR